MLRLLLLINFTGIKMHNLPIPCQSCKHKKSFGSMIDPCFPCLLNQDLFSGTKKRKFSNWTDERLSWEEIERWEKQKQKDFECWLRSNPELNHLLDKLVEQSVRRLNDKR